MNPWPARLSPLRETGRNIRFLGGHVLGYTNDQQLQILAAGLGKGLGLSKIDRNRISRPDMLALAINGDGALTFVHVIGLAHVRRGLWSDHSANGNHNVIEVRPCR